MKTPIFREARKTNIKGVGDCLKRGVGQFADLRRGLAKKGGVFEGVLIPQRTL